MKKLRLTIFTLSLGLYASPSAAQIFKLNFNPAGGLDPNVTTLINTEIQKIENDINKDLPGASSPDRLMEGMANSSVMAGKGIGTDYASGMKVFIIGAGVGAGADLTKSKDPEADISGAGVAPGLMLGTNLSWMDTATILGLDTNKLNIFVNFASYNLDKTSGDTAIDAKLSAMGVHVSYDWIQGNGSRLFGWGGVRITTGYERNSMKLSLNSKVNETLDYSNGGVTYNSNITGNPNATIDVSTASIPLNISTSVHFLYFLSLYGGLGADFNTGSATGKGTLNSSPANVTCSPTGSAACPVSGTAGTITTSANLDGKGDALPFLTRGFLGVQFNLPFTRIFVQADKAFGNNLIGATAGLRFVY